MPTPKKLLLIDGIGAIISAFTLGVLLVKFEDYIGMPRSVLYVLSAIACVFLIYSLTCYFLLTEHHAFYLKIIAIANLMYCLLSIGLVIFFYAQLTQLGLIYFLLEFAVLFLLIKIELQAAK